MVPVHSPLYIRSQKLAFRSSLPKVSIRWAAPRVSRIWSPMAVLAPMRNSLIPVPTDSGSPIPPKAGSMVGLIQPPEARSR